MSIYRPVMFYTFQNISIHSVFPNDFININFWFKTFIIIIVVWPSYFIFSSNYQRIWIFYIDGLFNAI